MAYRTQKSSSGTSFSRPSSSKVRNDYASSLSGFSSSLSDLRKQLVEEQVAQLDYEIEVGTASTEEKISLYESYLSSLAEGTQEWFRVSTKIQNLKDSADTEDFAYAKSLYAGNQISSEQYYRILKERAAESGLSEKEKRQRTTDLWEFERKMSNETTDTALRDSVAQEELGLITAADRLNLLQSAYKNETDPNRRESLKYQILTQQKKVYKEDLSIRELTIRKGIQEGVNTKADLLPIYAEKIQTAFTNEDALQAEINYQTLVEGIQKDYVQAFEKGSKDVKKLVNSEIGKLDKRIEQAKREGDVAALSLLYENKRMMIEDFFNSESVTLDDKQKSSNMFNFLKNVYGKDVDLETGNVIDVTPTDAFGVNVVEDALNNPDSSLLVRSIGPNGTSTVKLARGEKIEVKQPDGTTKSFYDFKDNLAVSRLDQTLTRELVDPITGEVMRDEAGNALLAPSLPSGRQIQKLPEGYRDALTSGNVKPLNEAEFKGEYVDLYNDPNGNPVRGYVVYGDKFANVQGASPIEGRPGSFLLTTKDNSIPSQKYVSDAKLFKPGTVATAALQVGAFIQKSVPGLNIASNVNKLSQNIGSVDPNKIAQIGFDSKDLQSRLANMNKDLTTRFSGVVGQLTGALFKQPQQSQTIATTIKPAVESIYGKAVQFATDSVLSKIPGYSFAKNLQTAVSFGKNVFNKLTGLGGK